MVSKSINLWRNFLNHNSQQSEQKNSFYWYSKYKLEIEKIIITGKRSPKNLFIYHFLSPIPIFRWAFRQVFFGFFKKYFYRLICFI